MTSKRYLVSQSHTLHTHAYNMINEPRCNFRVFLLNVFNAPTALSDRCSLCIYIYLCAYKKVYFCTQTLCFTYIVCRIGMLH